MSCCSGAARRRAVTFAWTALAVVGLFAGRGLAKTPITTTDLLRIRSVTSVDVAWDGTRAVYAVRSIGSVRDPDDAEGTIPVNQSHLYLVDLVDPAATPRRLTRGDRVDTAPVLSPDGMQIAFVRSPTRADDETDSQVWVMPVDGGEPRRVTDLPGGAMAPVWSPDGRSVLVASRVAAEELDGGPPWPAERPAAPPRDAAVEPRPDGTRAEIRAWLDENARRRDPEVITRLRFQGERELRGPRTVRHLFLVRVDDPADTRRMTRGFFDHYDPAFTPDGRAIIYAARKDPERHPDRGLGTNLWRLGVDDGADERLLALEGWSLHRPTPSRDGAVLAFLGRRLDTPGFRNDCIGTVTATPNGISPPTWLTSEETFDAAVLDFAWVPAQLAVYFTAARAGGFPLMTMAEGLLEPAALVEEQGGLPIGVHAFGVGGGRVVYSVTHPSNPCVLRVRDARGRDRLVHDLNAWVADRELSMPTGHHITRPDGTAVEYWVMPPTRTVALQRSPLAVEIHGGPIAMWGPGEPTMWLEFQLLCSWGYGVAYANPRGSGGYGYDFGRANYQDWGPGPGGDVLAVVDRVALEDWVDVDRMVVTGGSYGGYLTAWIVANDHRFKAAVAQRGVYDLTTFFGEGNAHQLVEWAMGGFPWNPRVRAVLQRESPFTYVNRIRTPLLIMHASEDLRTGVSQSEMLYRALKQLEKPVEYVRYPNAGHDLSRTGDPTQRMDRLNRIIEFFERYSGNERPAPVGGE
jgi:dipeptidyl aminopeptidase/acylaminoacyl peptidase